MPILRPRLPRSVRLVVSCAGVAAGLAACGGSTTPSATATGSAPANSASPSSSAASSLTLQQATLTTADFNSGATAGSSSNVPDLTNIKCTPNTTQGLQQQYKSDVVAASGREYGNVVASFDTPADAASFISSYLTGAQSCSDASTQPVQDNFGTSSFYYQITGTGNDLRVEAVQDGRFVTVVIQFIPSGTQPDQQSVRDATTASLAKLRQVSS